MALTATMSSPPPGWRPTPAPSTSCPGTQRRTSAMPRSASVKVSRNSRSLARRAWLTARCWDTDTANGSVMTIRDNR